MHMAENSEMEIRTKKEAHKQKFVQEMLHLLNIAIDWINIPRKKRVKIAYLGNLSFGIIATKK